MDILKSLHPYEAGIFPFLKDGISLDELVKKSKLKEIEVMRALQWLKNKEVLDIKKEEKERIVLGNNGIIYLKEGLPEKRFLKLLPASLKEISGRLDRNEVSIALGILKRKNAIEVKDVIKITKDGEKLLKEESSEEKFLKKLPLNHIDKNDMEIFNELKKRKDIIEIKKEKIVFVELTDLGKELIKEKIDTNLIESLNSKMIKEGSWKGKDFRYYDVKVQVPKIYPGKRHFVNQAIQYAKRIWLDLGFEEMDGPIINTSFWNFDALFVPQDHPAREMQDTFFIDKKGKLPKELVDNIKKVHEYGADTGSKGWKYRWDEELAKKLVLRTHTTVLSARTIAKLKKSDLPAKFFAIGRNYRNEALDWNHLFEFNQTEGIVIDPDANFRNLLGYLKEFFKKMGFDKARFRPAYFPYTEPSVEIDVYHPIKKTWFELGGAGMFRPEVVKPLLGIDVPVLAWGPGFDRIIMDYYKITDIRELYKNDIKQLRSMKLWLR